MAVSDVLVRWGFTFTNFDKSATARLSSSVNELNFEKFVANRFPDSSSSFVESLLIFFTSARSYTQRRSSYQLSWKLRFPWLSVSLRALPVIGEEDIFPAADTNYKLLIVERFKGRPSGVETRFHDLFWLEAREMRAWLLAAMAIGFLSPDDLICTVPARDNPG